MAFQHFIYFFILTKNSDSAGKVYKKLLFVELNCIKNLQIVPEISEKCRGVIWGKGDCVLVKML